MKPNRSLFARLTTVVFTVSLAALVAPWFDATSGASSKGNPYAQMRLAKAKTTSWYAGWVSDDPVTNKAVGRQRGCDQARNQPLGVIVLALGRQYADGATAFSRGVIGYDTLAGAGAAYAAGLAECGQGPYVLALATSNWKTGANDPVALGERWAQLVEKTKSRSAASADKVIIAGGNDIEPSWGPAEYSKAWTAAFSAGTRAPYVFIGSADGCPWRDGQAGCNNGWSEADVAAVAWPSRRSIVLPQVYDHDGRMAQQWARLSRGARREIFGVLVQNDACTGTDNENCPELDLTADEALEQLNQARPFTPVRTATDISWR